MSLRVAVVNGDGDLAVGDVDGLRVPVDGDFDAPDLLVGVRVLAVAVRGEDLIVELDGDGTAGDDDRWVLLIGHFRFSLRVEDLGATQRAADATGAPRSPRSHCMSG